MFEIKKIGTMINECHRFNLNVINVMAEFVQNGSNGPILFHPSGLSPTGAVILCYRYRKQ